MKTEKCVDFDNLLYDFADGLLDEEKTLEVKKHCDSCDNCRSIVSEIKMVTSLAGSLPEVHVPADKMWLGIEKRIDSSEATPEVAASISPGLFTRIYLYFKRTHLVAVPALVTALVLLGIFPAWFSDGNNPFLVSPNPSSTDVYSSEMQKTEENFSADISDASSEARWNMVEDAFSEVTLDNVTSDIYSDWEN